MKRSAIIAVILTMAILSAVAIAGDSIPLGVDNSTNSYLGPVTYPYNMCFDGTYWDRVSCTSGVIDVSLESEYVEDTAHVTADEGQMSLVVRNDVLASLCNTDGDYCPIQVDAVGGLYVTLTDVKYAEDVAATAADEGVSVLAVRNDALASLVDTDGDYSNLQVNALGALYTVESGATHDAAVIATGPQLLSEAKDFDGAALPDNVNVEGDSVRNSSSLYGIQYVMLVNEDGSAIGTMLTSSEIVDDAAFTPATSYIMMSGFEFDDVAPDSVDEGDGGAGRMSANRNIYTTLRDAAGNERGVNVTAGNALEIDIAEQSLTAVTISATAAANLVTNPIFTQISQDGTTAIGTANPLPISATVAQNTIANPIFTQVSATAAANLIDNPMFVQVSQDGTNPVDGTHPLPISKDLAVNAVANTIHVELSDGAASFLDNTTSPGYVRQQDGDSAVLTDVLDAGADDLANTLNGPVQMSWLYGFDGATWDRLTIDASGYLEVVDATTRPGEDSANGWRSVSIKDLNEGNDNETNGADTIAAAAVDILDPVDVSGYGNWCVYIKNTDAADAFSDLDILTNYENANWDDAVEIQQAVCADTLAADTMCVYCTSDTYKYIKVSATGLANPNESSSYVYLIHNQR